MHEQHLHRVRSQEGSKAAAASGRAGMLVAEFELLMKWRKCGVIILPESGTGAVYPIMVGFWEK